MGDVSDEYIAFARQLAANGSYSKAFDLFATALEKNPQIKTDFEQEFRLLVTKLNEILAVTGKMEEIFINFCRASKLFPNNVYLINEIGKHLYKFAFYTEALNHFRKAVMLDASYAGAEKNLNSVKNFLLERWHFRMLNDKLRNEAYHDAIRESIVPLKDSVLDLGTGTGLLAIYANECTPIATTGCDNSSIMTELAECILAENNIQLVVIVNKMSTDLNYLDIGGKRSLLVTEMFDAGLFGEHVLPSLLHAKEHLLQKVSRILPGRAEFFVAAVKCDQLHLRYQLSPMAKKLLNIPTLNVHVQAPNETYDSEDVHLYNNLKYMTDAQSLFKIDFNDCNDMQDKLTRTEPYNVELKPKESGEINVVVGWFNLYLTDNITITTDPRSDTRANAWEQAVFYDNVPQTVHENESIEVGFLLNGGKMSIIPNFNGHIMRISPETLRFLNDSEYINIITKCIGMSCVYLGQLAEMSQTKVVDLCPFPYFGLLMLIRGAQSVTCCAKTENDKKFFQEVFQANNVPLSKVTILDGEHRWDQEVFGDEKYHAIFTHVFEMCGDVDVHLRQITQHLKNTHLFQGGLFMPTNITLMVQLVSSHYMDINNRVYDENVSDYQIATHVNKYSVSQNFFLELTCLEYTALSDPFAVTTNLSEMTSDVVFVPASKSGECNAILCWYEIELIESMGVLSTKRANSIIDGMAFVTHNKVPMVEGELTPLLLIVDLDGTFKMRIDGANRF